jgi:hypothetical protein
MFYLLFESVSPEFDQYMSIYIFSSFSAQSRMFHETLVVKTRKFNTIQRI